MRNPGTRILANRRLTARGIHWPFDQGLRVPIIFRDAKNISVLAAKEQPGVVSDRVVSLLDLTATTLSIAGIERPLGMQSRVFLGPYADPPRSFGFAARDRIELPEFLRIRLRTPKFRRPTR